LKIQSEDDFLNLFIFVVDCTQFPEVSHTYNNVFHKYFQENFDPTGSTYFVVSSIKETTYPYSINIEISPGKTLNISPDPDSNQQEKIIIILQKHSNAFD